MSAYELADYEPEQRADYLRLLRDAWGDLALSGEEFDWWFRDNRVGSLMSVARVGGHVAGVASHSLFRLVFLYSPPLRKRSRGRRRTTIAAITSIFSNSENNRLNG